MSFNDGRRSAFSRNWRCRRTAACRAIRDFAESAKTYADRSWCLGGVFGGSTHSCRRRDVFEPAAPKLFSIALLGVLCEWFHAVVCLGITKPELSRSAKRGLMFSNPTCTGISLSRSMSNNLAKPAAPDAASQWPMLPLIELTTIGFTVE